MSAEEELQKWLNRSDRTFVDNLQFGIKVCNSIEFSLYSKYELVTEAFCTNLPKLRSEVEANILNDSWQVINEFLQLKYNAGSISGAIKSKLIHALINEAEQTIGDPFINCLKGVLIVYQADALQSYFRSKIELYLKFVATIVKYVNALIRKNIPEFDEEYSAAIEKLMEGLKSFVKETLFPENFQKACSTHLMVVLSELFIVLRHLHKDKGFEYFDFIKEVYFKEGGSQLISFLIGDKDSLGFISFPIHVLMTIVEAILFLFKLDVNIQSKLIEFVFEKYLVIKPAIFIDHRELIFSTTYFITLLKRSNCMLNFECNGQKATLYIGKIIERLVDNFYQTHLYDVLQLLSAVLHLNPMIFDQNIFSIAIKCMLLRKDDKTLVGYAEFLCLVIEMYRKLSRAEKFVSQLIKSLSEHLETVKLSKRLKRKISENESNDTINREDNFYMDILKESLRSMKSAEIKQLDDDKNLDGIAFAWPNSVADSFIKLVGQLMSKPSLVIWKTLIYSLNTSIEAIKQGKSDENSLFLLDILSTLFCQYFAGTRLTEHSDQLSEQIDTYRLQTRQLLNEFGTVILDQEHNVRTMNSFLQLCHSAANFDLLCWYYRLDSFHGSNNNHDIKRMDIMKYTKSLHSYVPEKQWNVIEQRITNFGRDECKLNLSKIYLQQIQSNILFDLMMKNDVPPFIRYDDQQLLNLLADPKTSNWLIDIMNPEEHHYVSELLLNLESNEIWRSLRENLTNRNFLKIFLLQLYKKIQSNIHSSRSVVKKINIDFENYNNPRKSIEPIVEIIKSSNTVKLKKFSEENILTLLDLLINIPFSFLDVDFKNLLFFINISLYCDLKNVESDELRLKCLEVFEVLLHFGDKPNIFGVTNISVLLEIFDNVQETGEIYKLIFDGMSRNTIQANEVFDYLLSKLREDETDDVVLEVSNILLDCISKEKIFKNQFNKLKDAILSKIKLYFANNTSNSNNIKRFVEQTLNGFSTIIASIFAQSKVLDTALWTICKIYLGHSITFDNSYAMKLVNILLANRDVNHLSDNEMKLITTMYYDNFKRSLSDQKFDINATNNSKFDLVLKRILDNQPNDDFAVMLNGIHQDINKDVKSFDTVKYKFLASIAKCQMNKMKGKLYNEFFKRISFCVISNLTSRKSHITDIRTTVQLLYCYKALVNNNQNPMSVELIDDILSILTGINIKRFPITEMNLQDFIDLHHSMSDLMHALIQHRQFFIVSRIPQFVNVLRDLLQSISLFKFIAKSDTPLDSGHVSMLGEMALRIETILKIVVKYSKDFKRVAPYLLIFIMNLIVSNDRPTTLYPKIKTHFENCCFEMISICDYRAEGFILRSCNEASRSLYEVLVNEYNKYRKFSGKV